MDYTTQDSSRKRRTPSGRRSKRDTMPTHCVYNGGRCGNALSAEEMCDGIVRCLSCRMRTRAVSKRYREAQKRGDFSLRPINRKRRNYRQDAGVDINT